MIAAHRATGPERAIQPLEEPDFYRVLAAVPGAALIIFTSDACAGCRRWRRLLEAYPARPDSRADLSLYSVDAQANMGLVREYEVFHLPALFLFHDGEFHCALHCEAALDSLGRAIETALAAPAQEAP